MKKLLLLLFIPLLSGCGAALSIKQTVNGNGWYPVSMRPSQISLSGDGFYANELNDNEFIDFYLKYNQIESLSEKTKNNINNISSAIENYREISNDFQIRLENIDKFIYENLEVIRKYDISEEYKNINMNLINTERTNFRHNLNNNFNNINDKQTISLNEGYSKNTRSIKSGGY